MASTNITRDKTNFSNKQVGLFTSALSNLPSSSYNATLVKKLIYTLSARFSNGFRINSPIELARLRYFIVEKYNYKIRLSDEELMEAIITCGILFCSKVYVLSSSVINHIKKTINDYFMTGAQVIFYSELYTKNEKWLFEARVISEEMMRGIIRKIFPEMKFTLTYFGLTDIPISNVLENEILRVWEDDILLTYNQLAKRLLYVPLERIKNALGQNSNFIWNSVGTFSHISKIDITEDEHKAICKIVQRKCNTHGYISITDLVIDEIMERNYELSITAAHNAIFSICLSDKFDKNGKIVTRKGEPINVLTIMKGYCQTVDRCSLDDLLNYEKELTGEIHYWVPMEAAYAVLVRTDKATFVADKYVYFDSNAIDKIITRFVNDNYLPLKYFTAFGEFPDCGHKWNLFLFESYCRRFSKIFRFDSPSVNSRNAGVIIKKKCKMTYTEIMADAVAKSGIDLTKDNVDRFLFDKGYIGRSMTTKVAEIIDKVKAMQGER